MNSRTFLVMLLRADCWPKHPLSILVLRLRSLAGAGGTVQWAQSDGEQGGHPEDEPAQVQQGGGHGRPHFPQ